MTLFCSSLILVVIHSKAMAVSNNPLLADKGQPDPSLFCTAFKRPRFYIFNQTEPESYVRMPKFPSRQLLISPDFLGTRVRRMLIGIFSMKSQPGKNRLWQLWHQLPKYNSETRQLYTQRGAIYTVD